MDATWNCMNIENMTFNMQYNIKQANFWDCLAFWWARSNPYETVNAERMTWKFANLPLNSRTGILLYIHTRVCTLQWMDTLQELNGQTGGIKEKCNHSYYSELYIILGIMIVHFYGYILLLLTSLYFLSPKVSSSLQNLHTHLLHAQHVAGRVCSLNLPVKHCQGLSMVR